MAKIQKTPQLSEGDLIEIGVTHQIRIGGEDSWVKYGVTTKVQAGENAEQARKRASMIVNKGVMDSINETVEAVRGAGS